VDLGGEVLVADLAGLEGFEFNIICVRFTVNLEHEVYSVAEMGGTAVDAGFVSVMDEDNCCVAMAGDVTENLENRSEGKEGVLICAGDDANKWVDDEEFSVGLGYEFLEVMDVFFEVEVEILHRGVVKGDVLGGVVSVHDLGEAVEETEFADLFINPEDVGEAGFTAQPGFAHCEGDGKVEGGVGFLCTGFTDEEVEGAGGDEVVNYVVGGLVGKEGGAGCPEFLFTVNGRGIGFAEDAVDMACVGFDGIDEVGVVGILDNELDAV